MQISNLVSQYNNSVANGEPMTGAKGVEKLVSSLNEMSKGMIFEGTVSSVRGNQVKLALSNGQQILARLAGKFSFEQGQSVFFQVKNNDGGTIEIKPYTVDGEGANLTLMDALKAAGLSVDGINLSMVNKMMEEHMPIDKTSLNQMYQLVQDNKDINVTTLVELKRLGIEINQVNAAQFENYANDKQAITIAMDSLIDELPNALSAEDLSMYKLVTQARDILNIVTEGLPEEAFISSEASDMSQYEAIMRDNKSAPVVKKHFNIAELFESLNSVSGESQDIHTTQKINNAPATDTILLQENETKSNTIGFLLSDKQIEELNEQVRMLLPDLQENNISLYSEDSSVVGILNDIKSMLDNTPANADTLRHLFSGEAFKLMLKEALEQQWMIKPGDLEKNPKKLDGLYDKIEKQITNMEIILKTSGVVNPKAEALADNIRGNIEFMNQINEAYTYVQVPLKMNEKNASGQLYVYTNKKSMSNPDKELSAFLHLDLEHLGGTDVSIKMLHRKVTTNFYLDSDESYALVKQFLPVLEKRLQDKGYNCELNVNSGSKQMNFVAGFLKKDLPPTGQVHRYSFDIRA
ncbi:MULTISPECIES: flagellar hook-length control protein FliK [Agathobacter]|uniref:Flagellar hook-length control protein FliK n=2 Tax=Agathobacter rectalis TaxID=39491 RepID=A0A174BLU3_9FIRM|nr:MULTISPECIES: flagellar hook-length control protein FliK [Agathobacter]RGN16953.1 flagellar hook-length control protein FliK [Agathobacter rectalis]RGN22131.1 flagellar hook-length control protein FliK [Agathobacter rectalis]RGN22337.1 flagellar hook-length control protein FliK [Agathobacter rectalis]RHD39034.1 flagellar hook-length control protein FliK [Agathobacter rectalis]CUO00655.1 Flagellar hook-length control protein FliK [Agathobacter rectalis]